MADAHLSIGEVLSLLRDDFPDITISKIRFLESQGLIDPERTPSGYRKFYDGDIDRLRWILVQQRENFLPLKVIKDRLQSSVGVPVDDGAGDQAPDGGATADDGSGSAPNTGPPTTGPPTTGEDPDVTQPVWMADVAASRGRPDDPGPGHAGVAETERPDGESLADAVPAPPTARRKHRKPAAGDSEVSLTAEELATAAGITIDALRELESYGLVLGRAFGDDTYYDGDALLVATKSAAFLGHGIGARHLRMFKVAAEREAGFLEQVAMPLLKARNPESRRQAVELVEELAGLGHDLRVALLRANLRQHLDRA